MVDRLHDSPTAIPAQPYPVRRFAAQGDGLMAGAASHVTHHMSPEGWLLFPSLVDQKPKIHFNGQNINLPIPFHSIPSGSSIHHLNSFFQHHACKPPSLEPPRESPGHHSPRLLLRGAREMKDAASRQVFHPLASGPERSRQTLSLLSLPDGKFVSHLLGTLVFGNETAGVAPHDGDERRSDDIHSSTTQ